MKRLTIVFLSLLLFFFGIASVTLAAPSKTSYSIAIYGDSMVDTMGEQLEYLQKALKKRYPKTTFYYYNYGIGSQSVTDGIQRFQSPFSYKTRNFQAVSSLKPDILIIGSFAYNPRYPYIRDEHWINLQRLVNESKSLGSDVYMLSEIAPLKTGFGQGPNGVNWPTSISAPHVEYIIQQLENSRYLAKDHLKLPLIDAYSASKSNGKYGAKKYVNPSDGIHPSEAGHQLMAELIASKIKLR